VWTPSGSLPPRRLPRPTHLGAGLGEPDAWGVEGTGSYGAALARFLAANDQVVLEVNRPDRQARRRRGKSDPLDAQAAARAVQAGAVTVTPKAGDGQVAMIRCLRVARATAMRARTQAINALKALLVTAPAELREQLRGLPATTLVRTAAQLDPGPITSPPGRGNARAAHPRRTPPGPVGRDHHAHHRAGPPHHPGGAPADGAVWRRPRQRRRAAGRRRRQPDRLHSEAAFSMLCGSSPIEASSGKTTRHRLNRGGDRQANAALYRIVLVRLCYDQATQDYMARRTKEGKSKKEIIRCLKRHVAREVCAVLHDMRTTDSTKAA
jgi:transposase